MFGKELVCKNRRRSQDHNPNRSQPRRNDMPKALTYRSVLLGALLLAGPVMDAQQATATPQTRVAHHPPLKGAVSPYYSINIRIGSEFAYAVEFSADLRKWELVQLFPIGTGDNTLLIEDTKLPAKSGFFRLRYWTAISPDEFMSIGQPIRFSTVPTSSARK